ncbi:dnaJ-like protein 60 [Ctenocephalides felis]|uniref:dnaJ-like protein 60 n=1 Tax=Ctenocephalides felis TaxID=7515 RepID=UPI000E6E501A|nr:dnaJ-like protein 60 [Ctenocephalides felis]
MPLRSVNYMLSVCVHNILRLSCRCRHRSHYDVLKLRKNCSTREIKASFIELSKKFHPDVNSGKRSHIDFLQISEAYKILSRPVTRRKYDAELAIKLRETTWPRRDMDPETWSDSTIWNSKNKTSQKPKPYYGIPGVKRLPNAWIVAMCLTTAGIALAAEVFLISTASRHTRQKITMQSMANEETLATVQAEARRFGNEIQLERLIARAKLSSTILPILDFPGQAEKLVNSPGILNVEAKHPTLDPVDTPPPENTSAVNVIVPQTETDLNIQKS